MKNLTRILFVVLAVMALYSCEDYKRSSASYYLGVTFETSSMTPGLVDSVVYSPLLSWDQIVYFKAEAKDVNVGYEGGFVLSSKKGSPNDTDDMARFVSADPGAGAEKSSGYVGFYKGDKMPDYDVVLDLRGYYTATSSIVGCYLCNSELTKRFSETVGFEPGDYLRVVFDFYKSDLLVGTLEKYLVDYSGTELKMVNEWEAWDMTETETKVKIPTYDSIKINVETSRPEIVPCFCMDDFITYLSVEY